MSEFLVDAALNHYSTQNLPYLFFTNYGVNFSKRWLMSFNFELQLLINFYC